VRFTLPSHCGFTANSAHIEKFASFRLGCMCVYALIVTCSVIVTYRNGSSVLKLLIYAIMLKLVDY